MPKLVQLFNFESFSLFSRKTAITFNCIYAKSGAANSEMVTVELLKSYYLPFLLYGGTGSGSLNASNIHPPYLHNLITTQRPRSTLSSSVVTLARPSSSSSLKITDRSFRYASHCLWNQLPLSLR